MSLTFSAEVKNKKATSPLLYGLFLEDINHSIDGGLNANLIQNGNFDFCAFTYDKPVVENKYDHLKFWDVFNASVTNEKPISDNKPYSLKITGSAKIINQGYELENGKNYIYLTDDKYDCSFFYCCNKSFNLKAYFIYNNGKIAKAVNINLTKTKNYKLISFKLSAIKNSFAHIVFTFEGEGAIYVTHFKLIGKYFTSANNKYKYGKFNPALVNALNMGAKFLRFPGGCVVEGDASCNYLYEWEKTIGPTWARASKPSVWNYLQSSEIGFFEYFCLCEDLNLSPLPVHHVGLICQIRTEVFRHLGYIALHPNSVEFKEKVIDSVAHLIYFALGDVNSLDSAESLWANKRKSMGHAKPFNLKMIALGNENWDKVYFRNFNACVRALKNYPYKNKKVDLLSKFGVQILSSSGVDINPQDTNPSWRYINKNYTNLIIDEHVYNTPTWFVDNFYRYDYYNPNLSKVFMGEYACHIYADGKGKLGGKNTFSSALCEAAFMCGMENNPDIVKLSCYAPLLAKINQQNWDPDLIYFDKNKTIFTPNYYVQLLFLKNYGKYSIKLNYNRNFDNSGTISIIKNKNTLKKVEIKNLNNVPLNVTLKNNKINKSLSNYIMDIQFEKVVDGFTIVLGEDKSAGFKFMVHYNILDKAIYLEKIVNNTRMTLERLVDVELQDNLTIKYTENEIVLFVNDNKRKKLFTKPIWKTNTTIFTSLTYDNHNIYLKVVNVGEKQSVNFNLNKLIKTNTTATVTSLLQHPNNDTLCKTHTKTILVNKTGFKFMAPTKSVNIINIKI